MKEGGKRGAMVAAAEGEGHPEVGLEEMLEESKKRT